jgi:prolyl oligopeptidase
MQIMQIPSRSFSPLPRIAAATLAAVVWFLPSAMAQNGSAPAKPPAAPLRPVTDDYFGIEIKDPYRYLENLDDPEVKTWLKTQSDYTRAVLTNLPGRTALRARIKELDESAPAKVRNVQRTPNGRYFYLKTLSKDNTAKLYMREGLAAEEKLLVDPDKLAPAGGPPYAINYFSASDDGRYAAYGASPGGSENAVIHILDIATGKDTGEAIDRAQFGITNWRSDNKSFFYNRLQKLGNGAPPTDRYLKSATYLHVVGENPDKDAAIFGFELSPAVKSDAADLPFVAFIPNTTFAIGVLAHGVQNEVTIYVAPVDSLGKSGTPWRLICDVEAAVTNLTARGDELYLLTHKGASRFKVIHTKLSEPNVARADVVVSEGEPVLTNLGAAADALYVQELDGGIGRLLRIPYGSTTPGKSEQLPLPFEGSINIESVDPRIPGIVFTTESWVKGPRIYTYDPKTSSMADTKLRPAGPFDNPPDLTSIEVKAPSYDGTLVPLSIVFKAGIQLDGSHPAILRGYGAYGITEDPFFDAKLLAWMERGGVYAIGHLRGGGEYGEDWHKAGYKLTKPNTWRDMIACGKYLVDQKYTSSARLAAFGGSAGGITVGRTITAQPEAFGAAIIGVGELDTLRSEAFANGIPNIPEFGSVKTREGFEDLLAMSAYAHVRDGVPYPAVMLTTGLNDPRVASWMPAKMTARLQAATTSEKPVLLRVDYEAGHGIGSTKTQQQELLADEMSFLLWQFGVSGF